MDFHTVDMIVLLIMIHLKILHSGKLLLNFMYVTYIYVRPSVIGAKKGDLL